MSSFRFSGHDTFHCKEQWLLKGLQLFDNHNTTSVFREDEDAISQLGVGKNMVRAVLHWLKSFGLIDENSNYGLLSKSIFIGTKYDPFLENEGTLWLLQYFLCKSNYASIFKIIFSDYFLDKASSEFSESQIVSYIKRNTEQKVDKTLIGDFKVFIKTYVPPKRNIKTVEDDFNAPLLPLRLIVETGKTNGYGEMVYKVNQGLQESVSEEIFAYCLLDQFSDNNSPTYKDIHDTIGSYLCFSNEGLELIIEKMCSKYPEFIYKQDAGVRQLQFKVSEQTFMDSLLKAHYEIHS